jgi:hypothetical protein
MEQSPCGSLAYINLCDPLSRQSMARTEHLMVLWRGECVL